MNIPKVIDRVVKNDLCIGCGLCVYKCPNNALVMKWNNYGFLVPYISGECDSTGKCLLVCPFNPYPSEELRTENEISELFLQSTGKYHPKIGKYIGIYAGYSKKYRLSSSSGGIATYILTELLEQGIVDHIFSVKESQLPGIHYEYAISSSKEELLNASKTRYYPVTLSTVMPRIHDLRGKVAIVGVACFIKAIRLAQYTEESLKGKISFLVGLICGGVKSKFFTEYLASKIGVEAEKIIKPQFRIKDLKSIASDYSFGCINSENHKEQILKMSTVGDMWGTGLFKSNACDFCDDVTTELADISLGDAWLHPYNKDGAGTNIIVTRSAVADNFIKNGNETGKLVIEPLSLENFIASQQGSFNHRQKALGYRMRLAEKKGMTIPPKRHDQEKISLDFKLVQKQRMVLRRQSLVKWLIIKDSRMFDKTISKPLKLLQKRIILNHYLRAVKRRIGL